MRCYSTTDLIPVGEEGGPSIIIPAADFVLGQSGGVNGTIQNPITLDDYVLTFDNATQTIIWKLKKEDAAPQPSTGSGLLTSEGGVYSFYDSPGFVYIDSAGAITPIADGTNGQQMVMYNGAPTWSSGNALYLDITSEDGLKSVVTSGPATVTITGRKLTLTNDNGGIYNARNFSVVCRPNWPTALGGIDTITQSPPNWYYAYVISDGINLNAILSLDKNKPLFPTGYTYYRRVSAVYLRSTSVIDYFLQRGNFVKTDGAYFNGSIAIPTGAEFIPGTIKTIPSQIPPIAHAASLEIKIGARTGTACVFLQVQGYLTPVWIPIGVPPMAGGGTYSIIYNDIPIEGDNANISWQAGTTDITQASAALVGYKIYL
jgi:hypothetical protein